MKKSTLGLLLVMSILTFIGRLSASQNAFVAHDGVAAYPATDDKTTPVASLKRNQKVEVVARYNVQSGQWTKVRLSSGPAYIRTDDLTDTEQDKRNWQTGKVLDYDTSHNFAVPVLHDVYENYRIEVGNVIYIGSRQLSWRWSKEAHLTVNATIRMAIEKRKLWFIDDDGREFEAEIVKKIQN